MLYFPSFLTQKVEYIYSFALCFFIEYNMAMMSYQLTTNFDDSARHPEFWYLSHYSSLLSFCGLHLPGSTRWLCSPWVPTSGTGGGLESTSRLNKTRSWSSSHPFLFLRGHTPGLHSTQYLQTTVSDIVSRFPVVWGGGSKSMSS